MPYKEWVVFSNGILGIDSLNMAGQPALLQVRTAGAFYFHTHIHLYSPPRIRQRCNCRANARGSFRSLFLASSARQQLARQVERPRKRWRDFSTIVVVVAAFVVVAFFFLLVVLLLVRPAAPLLQVDQRAREWMAPSTRSSVHHSAMAFFLVQSMVNVHRSGGMCAWQLVAPVVEREIE